MVSSWRAWAGTCPTRSTSPSSRAARSRCATAPTTPSRSSRSIRARAAALQFKTNAAEVKAQIEELSDALNQLVAKEFTVHITQAHAAGGPVFGPDTVPARLTHGEFVMNVPATRRFAPLLDAMNKGRDVIVPQRFAGGGPVGDVVNINQTFNGPGDKEYARRVMIPAIEQAVRRGRAGRPW